jgi:hypothetical protein
MAATSAISEKRPATSAHKPRVAKPAAASPGASEVPIPTSELSEEKVRARAYEKWEAAGRPSGDGVCYWLEAEQELLHAD